MGNRKTNPETPDCLQSALNDLLSHNVRESEQFGSYDASHCLGIRQMPDGYALMLNPDCTHYYWLRYDGVESVISWDKWAAYRGAKADKENQDELDSDAVKRLVAHHDMCAKRSREIYG